MINNESYWLIFFCKFTYNTCNILNYQDSNAEVNCLFFLSQILKTAIFDRFWSPTYFELHLKCSIGYHFKIIKFISWGDKYWVSKLGSPGTNQLIFKKKLFQEKREKTMNALQQQKSKTILLSHAKYKKRSKFQSVFSGDWRYLIYLVKFLLSRQRPVRYPTSLVWQGYLLESIRRLNFILARGG